MAGEGEGGVGRGWLFRSCRTERGRRLAPLRGVTITVVRRQMPAAALTAGRARRAAADLFGPRRVHPRTVAALVANPPPAFVGNFRLRRVLSPLVPTANPKQLTATANRLIVAADERSLQVDLVRLDRNIPTPGCVATFGYFSKSLTGVPTQRCVSRDARTDYSDIAAAAPKCCS
jgi:hypothetical protein